MLDLYNLKKYKENNRIEAKKALGGLPVSLWETYSAFANTLGGIILLGVEERPDKSLHAVDLPDAEWMVCDFWEIINDKHKVSSNILTEDDVQIKTINGKHIIVINVPRAPRNCRPIYIGSDPMKGSYRRNGEGDYRCTQEQVLAMLRDADILAQDSKVIEYIDLSSLSTDALGRYRRKMLSDNLSALPDKDFVIKIGAAAFGDDGRRHPTAAGLLMFGNIIDIKRAFPDFHLRYEEYSGDRLNFRISSDTSEKCGCIFSFFFTVYNRLAKLIRFPYAVEKGDTPVHRALREAIANCLINADYYGRQGVISVKRDSFITLSNPGGFRISIEKARDGGISDPRNPSLIRMFDLIGIGKNLGSGIPDIFRIWEQQGWNLPVIVEEFEPERTTLSLFLEPPELTDEQKSAIVDYLTDNISGTAEDIAEYLDVSLPSVSAELSRMLADDLLVCSDGRYRLKS